MTTIRRVGLTAAGLAAAGLAAMSVTTAACATAVILRRWRWGRPGYDVRGRTVLVTGGARGLGFLLAREFGRQGARVVIVSRTAEELARAERRLRADGCDVVAWPCDVRDPSQVARTVSEVVDRTGALDVLVNNAGVIQVTPLAHATLEDFKDSLDTHLWGPLHLVRECLPHMRQRGGGRILNISSIGGRVGVPHLVPYSVGKFALVGLSEGLRAELAGEHILVTTATPGLMRTGSHLRALVRGQHARETQWFGAGVVTPLSSMSAPRAARQMVRACLEGKAHVTPGVQARVAEVLNVVAPGLSAAVARLVTSYVLPGPSSAASADALREARAIGFGWLMPLLPNRAAVRHNIVPDLAAAYPGPAQPSASSTGSLPHATD
jgi:NAD(P)-dependent dehydrogenase (short-subunit alcohol dehydrogenase family)